jgi:hypothetical protein
MPASTPAPAAQPGPEALHAGFLALLPRIERHGRVCFRGVKCPHRKADFLAEMAGIAWRWYVRLARRGKDAGRFPSALAAFAARAVRSGRRLCGQERARDALSPLAQRRRGFAVGPIFSGRLNGDILDEALRDNRMTPVPDQVAFRCDFPEWLRTYDRGKRRLIRDLMAGARTLDAAAKHRLSAARVSQLRREFHRDWVRFGADRAGRRGRREKADGDRVAAGAL